MASDLKRHHVVPTAWESLQSDREKMVQKVTEHDYKGALEIGVHALEQSSIARLSVLENRQSTVEWDKAIDSMQKTITLLKSQIATVQEMKDLCIQMDANASAAARQRTS